MAWSLQPPAALPASGIRLGTYFPASLAPGALSPAEAAAAAAAASAASLLLPGGPPGKRAKGGASGSGRNSLERLDPHLARLLSAASTSTTPAEGSSAGQGKKRTAPGAVATHPSSEGQLQVDVPGQARRLLALLLECWAECGPTKTLASPELEPLQALTGILSAATLIVQQLLLSRGAEEAAAGSTSAAGGNGGQGEAQAGHSSVQVPFLPSDSSALSHPPPFAYPAPQPSSHVRSHLPGRPRGVGLGR